MPDMPERLCFDDGLNEGISAERGREPDGREKEHGTDEDDAQILLKRCEKERCVETRQVKLKTCSIF